MELYMLVAGSRDYENVERFTAVMEQVIGWFVQGGDKVTIIEGGARGVDTMARNYALKNGLELIEIEADWEKYGRAAGPKRNDEMVKLVKEKGGEALFFWDGKSKGTKQCIRSAMKADIDVTVYLTTENRFLMPWEVPT